MEVQQPVRQSSSKSRTNLARKSISGDTTQQQKNRSHFRRKSALSLWDGNIVEVEGNNCKTTQCIMSPPLEDRILDTITAIQPIDNSLRTDDETIVSLDRYFKLDTNLPPETTAKIISVIKDPTLSNHQVIRTIRGLFPDINDDLQYSYWRGISEFIKSCDDPVPKKTRKHHLDETDASFNKSIGDDENSSTWTDRTKSHKSHKSERSHKENKAQPYLQPDDAIFTNESKNSSNIPKQEEATEEDSSKPKSSHSTHTNKSATRTGIKTKSAAEASTSGVKIATPKTKTTEEDKKKKNLVRQASQVIGAMEESQTKSSGNYSVDLSHVRVRQSQGETFAGVVKRIIHRIGTIRLFVANAAARGADDGKLSSDSSSEEFTTDGTTISSETTTTTTTRSRSKSTSKSKSKSSTPRDETIHEIEVHVDPSDMSNNPSAFLHAAGSSYKDFLEDHWGGFEENHLDAIQVDKDGNYIVKQYDSHGVEYSVRLDDHSGELIDSKGRLLSNAFDEVPVEQRRKFYDQSGREVINVPFLSRYDELYNDDGEELRNIATAGKESRELMQVFDQDGNEVVFYPQTTAMRRFYDEDGDLVGAVPADLPRFFRKDGPELVKFPHLTDKHMKIFDQDGREVFNFCLSPEGGSSRLSIYADEVQQIIDEEDDDEFETFRKFYGENGEFLGAIYTKKYQNRFYDEFDRELVEFPDITDPNQKIFDEDGREVVNYCHGRNIEKIFAEDGTRVGTEHSANLSSQSTDPSNDSTQTLTSTSSSGKQTGKERKSSSSLQSPSRQSSQPLHHKKDSSSRKSSDISPGASQISPSTHRKTSRSKSRDISPRQSSLKKMSEKLSVVKDSSRLQTDIHGRVSQKSSVHSVPSTTIPLVSIPRATRSLYKVDDPELKIAVAATSKEKIFDSEGREIVSIPMELMTQRVLFSRSGTALTKAAKTKVAKMADGGLRGRVTSDTGTSSLSSIDPELPRKMRKHTKVRQEKLRTKQMQPDNDISPASETDLLTTPPSPQLSTDNTAKKVLPPPHPAPPTCRQAQNFLSKPRATGIPAGNPVAPDSSMSAQSYIQKHGIHQLFEMFTKNLVLERPTKPLDYLIQLVHDIGLSQQRRNARTV